MPPLIDLMGRRFGRLEAIGRGDNDKHGKPMWICQCDCGRLVQVIGSQLRKENGTRSCGCIQKEIAAENCRAVGLAGRLHGMTGSPEHQAWLNAIQRCGNPNHPEYKNYGARGIRMCDEWLDSFEEFYSHIGPRPSPEHSLDRENVNGNYEPGNVRWATIDVQNSNKRTSRQYIERLRVQLPEEDHHE